MTENHDQVGNRAFGERLEQLVDPARFRAASMPLPQPSPGPHLHGAGLGGERAVSLFLQPRRRAGAQYQRGGKANLAPPSLVRGCDTAGP